MIFFQQKKEIHHIGCWKNLKAKDILISKFDEFAQTENIFAVSTCATARHNFQNPICTAVFLPFTVMSLCTLCAYAAWQV